MSTFGHATRLLAFIGVVSDARGLLQVLSFILSHTTDGPGAAVLDAALSTELSPLKAKVSRPLLLAPIIGKWATILEAGSYIIKMTPWSVMLLRSRGKVCFCLLQALCSYVHRHVDSAACLGGSEPG